MKFCSYFSGEFIKPIIIQITNDDSLDSALSEEEMIFEPLKAFRVNLISSKVQ